MRTAFPPRHRPMGQLPAGRGRRGIKGRIPTLAKPARIDWIRAKAPNRWPSMLLIGGPKQFGRKEPSMRIIGCDFHPRWQQICWMETTTGEIEEKKLEHALGEAERF